MASGLFECSRPKEWPNSWAATWNRLTPSVPKIDKNAFRRGRRRSTVRYFSSSNTRHYQNVYHHHTEERMHGREHYQDHRKVRYHRDHPLRTRCEDRFCDRYGSTLILRRSSSLFDGEILSWTHCSTAKIGRKIDRSMDEEKIDELSELSLIPYRRTVGERSMDIWRCERSTAHSMANDFLNADRWNGFLDEPQGECTLENKTFAPLDSSKIFVSASGFADLLPSKFIDQASLIQTDKTLKSSNDAGRNLGGGFASFDVTETSEKLLKARQCWRNNGRMNFLLWHRWDAG